MLKMRIPPEAVQHKMTKDQVDARIVDAVLGTSSTTESKSEKSNPPSLSEEEEKLAYFVSQNAQTDDSSRKL